MWFVMIISALAVAAIAFPHKGTRVDPERKYRDYDIHADENDYLNRKVIPLS